MAMRSITRAQIDELILDARQTARKRKILRLHEHHEPVQRMINAMIPGTYITPHKHESPDKVELFSILKGRVAVIEFGKSGEIVDVLSLSQNGEEQVVDILPRTYHTIVPLEPSACLEIIEGPYDAATHKHFAPWAPSEDSPEVHAYLMQLTSIIEQWN